jgi:hypothetical protein
LLSPDDQGMASIVAPVEPDDYIRFFGIEINDFSLPFVTPLGPDNHHICHDTISPIMKLLEILENYSPF